MIIGLRGLSETPENADSVKKLIPKVLSFDEPDDELDPIVSTPQPVAYAVKSEMQILISDWLDARDIAIVKGVLPPPLPNALCINLMEICKKLGRRPNFNAYTYLDEMIGDAIYDCTKAVKNFKHDHVKKNPFGYFSRVAWNAFIRRIDLEKSLQILKVELMYDENHIPYTINEGDDAHIDKNDVRNFMSNNNY
jgi:hypothetical protein